MDERSGLGGRHDYGRQHERHEQRSNTMTDVVSVALISAGGAIVGAHDPIT
jgi:hypothetical protein